MKYILIFLLPSYILFALDAFITPINLKKNLNDEKIIILDADDISLYNNGHITTALHIDVNSYIYKQPNPYKLMKSDDIIKKKLQNLGIDKGSKIVIYDHNSKNSSLKSSYLAFILISFGFENVSILDGGYMAWVFENERLVSSKATYNRKKSDFITNKNKNIIIKKKYLLDNISKITMLDARESKYYYGTHKSKKITMFGHIKGAKSSYYGNKFLLDGTLRHKNELNDMYFLGLELKKNEEIIVYADNIFQASMEWYILYSVMKFKGAKIYEASLLEYFNTKKHPMTRFKWE